eukprot:scaffold651315_cov50-Prasinocladus_malaysianus.AAC.1
MSVAPLITTTMTEAVVQFVVYSAQDLPKTDTFSAIDPFIRIATSTGAQFETKHVDDNANPTWNQTFTFKAPISSDGRLLGTVELTVYDED